MVAITIVTQVLMILKSSLVAGMFGTGLEMDAFNLSNNIVSFIVGFLSSGVATIIIPAYVEKKEKSANAFLTLLYCVLISLVVLVIVFRTSLMGLITNKSDLYVQLACQILIILLLANILSSISDITTAFLQCKNKYVLPKLLTFVAQAIVVVCLFIFRDITIIQYALILASGLLINFVLNLAFGLAFGWRFVPNFHFLDEEARKMLLRFLPILFSSGIYRVSLMVDTLIASNLDEGLLSVLSYSNQISGMVNSVFIGTLLVYYYPKLVSKSKEESGKDYLWSQTFFFNALMWMLIAGFFAVGQDGVKLLFERGSFTAEDSYLVYVTTLLYIIGLQSNVIRDLIYRYYYSKGNTKVAAVNSVIVTILNISISLLLVKLVGFYGIVFGTIASSLLSTIIIFVGFGRRNGYGTRVFNILSVYARNVIFGIITCLLVYLLKCSLPINNTFLRILFFGLVSVVLFVALEFLFNKRTLNAFKEM